MKLHYESVTSTNDLVKKLLADNDCPVVIVSADKQTNGRGRLGRTWESEVGNVYMSIGIKKTKNESELREVSPQTMLMSASLSVKSVIDCYIDEELKKQWKIIIKYPNDIQLEHINSGKRYKVSGMLLETTYLGSEWVSVVIGIGINTNYCPKLVEQQLKNEPLALRDVIKKEVNNQEVVDKVVDNFLWKTKRDELSIISEWKNEVNLLNKTILINNTEQKYLVTEILNDGTLTTMCLATNEIMYVTDQDSFQLIG